MMGILRRAAHEARGAYGKVAMAALGAGLLVLACSSDELPDDVATDDGADGATRPTPTPSDAADAGRLDSDVTSVDAALADAVADAPADADADADAALLSPTFVYRDINQIISTGQSLSLGLQGSPPLTETQPYDNLMFNIGVIASGDPAAFVPLVEGDNYGSSFVETMSSSLANLVTKVAREKVLVGQPPGRTSHDLLVSVHGAGATAYSGLKKGSGHFDAAIGATIAARDLAVAQGKSHVVRVVTNVHGEADHLSGNTAYATDLAAWQSDYETDLKAVTGQSDPIPMLHTQMSSWPRLPGREPTSLIPLAQLAAHVDNPGRIVLVGPKYHLPYSDDGVHLSNEGYRHMGEDHAKVYQRVILEGKRWEPLRPKSVSRGGAVVMISFFVPAPPLVIDTAAVTDPGNFGFEFASSTGDLVPITSVAVTGSDSVAVTLAAAPSAGGRLRYAHRGEPGAPAGPATGPRGNLRDSDATASRHGYSLFNWCVHFDVPVP